MQGRRYQFCVPPVSRRLNQIGLAAIQRILASARDGGFTFHLLTTKTPSFDSQDFVVSVEGHECRLSHPIAADAIRAWVQSRVRLLSQPDHYVGGWFNQDDGSFYLDVSIIVKGRIDALVVGGQQRQTKIYHPSSGETIDVPDAFQIRRKRAG